MSRKILPSADVFVFVSDPSITGIRTVARLSDLAEEVGVDIGRKILIINNAPETVPAKLEAVAKEAGFYEMMLFPRDQFIIDAALESELLDVPEDSPFGKATDELLKLIL